MASGNDARLGIAKEATYGTRIAPTRFLPFMGETLAYTYNKYTSRALGVGRWTRPKIRVTSMGEGSIEGEVPTTGFGYLLDSLHNNVVTPVQQASSTAYLQTHTLDTASAKSYTVQVQTPPVTSPVLLPHDLLGVMMGGIEFAWEEVLTYTLTASVQGLDVAQSLATYTPPAAWDLLSFKGGSLSIAGTPQVNIIGAGSLSIQFDHRTGVYYLGTSGLMAKPVENDKPVGSGTCTADFTDNTHLQRTIADTIGDVVLKFEGSTIATTYKYTLTITLPDCEFSSPRPTVTGPGPVEQPIEFSTASNTNDPIVITYQSTDTVL